METTRCRLCSWMMDVDVTLKISRKSHRCKQNHNDILCVCICISYILYIYISVTLTHSYALISDPDVHRIQRLEHCHTEAIYVECFGYVKIYTRYRYIMIISVLIANTDSTSQKSLVCQVQITCRYMNASKLKWMSMPIGNIPHQRHLHPCQIEKTMSTETFSIHTVQILCKEMKKSESIQLLWMEPCSPSGSLGYPKTLSANKMSDPNKKNVQPTNQPSRSFQPSKAKQLQVTLLCKM